MTYKNVSPTASALRMSPCTGDFSRWGTEETNQFMDSHSLLCLTSHGVGIDVRLTRCRGAKQQQWKFKKFNHDLKNSMLTSKQLQDLNRDDQMTDLLPPLRDSTPVSSASALRVDPTNDKIAIPLTPNAPSTQPPIANLSDEVHRIIQPLHAEFKLGLKISHEDKLATEIRDVYCEVSRMKKHLAISVAQTNGFIAASILQLGQCARIQCSGATLFLHQCKSIRVDVTAVETECGFQSFHTYKGVNYTIGIDGWSLHPFQNCHSELEKMCILKHLLN